MNKIPDSRRYTHDYEGNAKGYADLDIANTFALAYREIERIVKDNGLSGQAIDVGCGGGRSTRFLKSLGLPCIGVDIEPVQVEQSLKKDPSGDYRIAEKGVIPIQSCSFDLSLSCIALLECPSITDLESAVAEIARVTKVGGHVIVVTNSEDAFKYNWASFECDFPENKALKSGEQAKVIVRGTDAVFYDYFWTDSDYRSAFYKAGLSLMSLTQPLANGDEPYQWVSEKERANWSVYLLKKER